MVLYLVFPHELDVRHSIQNFQHRYGASFPCSIQTVSSFYSKYTGTIESAPNTALIRSFLLFEMPEPSENYQRPRQAKPYEFP